MSAAQTQKSVKNGADSFDARTFLSGLRSISLRNLSIRNPPPGERDVSSVSSFSLPSLRAIIMLEDPGTGAIESAPEREVASDVDVDVDVSASSTESDRSHGRQGTAKVLITTRISQPTVNPTWSVSETSWLRSKVDLEELDNALTLLLRVFACPHHSPSSLGLGGTDAGHMVWETGIDVAALTALPTGVRLSDLAALPANSVLLKMSNGGLYAPGWVVRVLEVNSVLPGAVSGRGISGDDAWRDESDGDEDNKQAPLDEVLRKVLALEREAEKGRRELAACLEKADATKRRSLEAAKTASNLDSLRRERSTLEDLLEAEEALLEREKRQLEAETLAVEELLQEVTNAAEATDAEIRTLERERRETMKSHILLEARRARLTAELQAIYPIKYHEKLGAYTIRGLEVPADLYSVDDEKVSSALGYTAHLVCMLAKYLQVPLRYQLIYNASRSAVRDNVTGAGVAYPLFRRGVEKERFDRGVHLLSRDVEQVLVARGVPVKRGTGQLLRNLERLMTVEGV